MKKNGGKAGVKGTGENDGKNFLKALKAYRPGKPEKSTVIVLTAAAVLFLAAYFWVHAGGVLNGEGAIFSVYGNETVEFEKGTVTEILSEEIRIDEPAEDSPTGTQELAVKVKSGRYKGETLTVYNYFGAYSGIPVAVSDSVAITIKTYSDGTRNATVYEFNRIPTLAVLLALFFLVTILSALSESSVQSLRNC